MDLIRKGSRSTEATKRRLLRALETVIKCVLLLLFPLPSTAVITTIWYFFLYKPHIFFAASMEGIIASAWIPTFGLLYSLLAVVVLNTVWNEYKTMRSAIKRYDVEVFVDLKDEEMSPLVHVMMIVFSFAILGAFMGLRYPDVLSGALLIASTSYLFGLVFWVVVEIDDPCAGIWFIKTIHKEWLDIDTKIWLKNRHERVRAMLLKEK